MGVLGGVARRLRGRSPRADRRSRPDRSGCSATHRPLGRRRPSAPAVFERRGSKLYLPGAEPRLEGREAEALALEHELESAGVRATKVADDELARFLEAAGGSSASATATRSEPERSRSRRTSCSPNAGPRARFAARFRDLVGTGRRDAQLLLERFDADGLTRRQGDARVCESGYEQTVCDRPVGPELEPGASTFGGATQ